MQFRIAYLKVSENDEIVTPYLIIVNELSDPFMNRSVKLYLLE